VANLHRIQEALDMSLSERFTEVEGYGSFGLRSTSPSIAPSVIPSVEPTKQTVYRTPERTYYPNPLEGYTVSVGDL
jgi:hypothetical protein